MPDLLPLSSAGAVVCGPYIVRRAQHSISVLGVPLVLDALEFEVLAALLEQCGAVLSEPLLMARLSSDAAADGASLWHCVSALNAKLAGRSRAAGYIGHYPELGFSLVLPAEMARNKRPPPPVGPLIGRDDALALLAAQLPLRRFVTIVGAGGMGKTALALALAEQAKENYADGVCFVDLAPLADGALLPAALASALALRGVEQDTLPYLIAYLRDKQMLIVFDSCEHIVADAAVVAEAIASAVDGVHILSTSREPLLASGEWLHQLAPMRIPAPSAAISAAEALRYPALQLLVERVRARSGGADFVLSETQAPLACVLCQRLDGIPLAIELAAAWVPLLGIERLAEQIGARLLEVADPVDPSTTRHRTLAATLDWSYDLLSAHERLILRRLSVFRAGFTLEAAAAVLPDSELEAETAIGIVLDLMAKSLVTRGGEQGMHYRLLDTTRLYAGDKLDAEGERPLMLRRHGAYLCQLLARADLDWEQMERPAWLATYAPWTDDIWAVLDWAFGAEGDQHLALTLTAASLSLGHQASLTVEFWHRAERAVELAPRLSADADSMLTVRLYIYLGCMHQRLPSDMAQLTVLLEQALANAMQVRNASYPASLLTGLWGSCFIMGDYPGALSHGQRLAEVARDCSDNMAMLISMRVCAQSLHFLGQHGLARQYAMHVLENSWRTIPLAYNPSPVSVCVSMRIVLARILWLQGMPDQARRMAADSLGHAEGDIAVAICQALALAVIPIALWCGDDAAALPLIERLHSVAGNYRFDYWRLWARHYQDVLARRSGLQAIAVAPDGGPRVLDVKQRDHLVTFDPVWLNQDSVARLEAGLVGWNGPEILRAQAERRLADGDHNDDRVAAEDLLLRALTLAREQGALAWQLRSAVSLARLWQGQGRQAAALDLLAPLYQEFREGHETADLRQARQLLDRLAQT